MNIIRAFFLITINVEYCTNTIIKKSTSFGKPEMNTMNVKKVGLDSWYDKRRMLNQVATEPYGLKSFNKLPIWIRLEVNMRARAKAHIT